MAHGVDAFFAECAAMGLAEAPQRAEVEAFVAKHIAAGRKIALVTSGATTVPMERNTVRYITNFSSGTRGALSAEEFLAHGYAVVFLYHRHSIEPFHKRFPHMTNSLLAKLEESADGGGVMLRGDCVDEVLPALRAYKRVQAEGTLLRVGYLTLHEYLVNLRMCCRALRGAGPRALSFLAAAVSDYYIPLGDTPEHKIQSAEHPTLDLVLHPVPKMLGCMVRDWAPGMMHISFKLETDEALLLPKCRRSMANYGIRLVVGNLLQRRRDEVRLVAPDDVEVLRRTPGGESDVESLLVRAVARRHDVFCTTPHA